MTTWTPRATLRASTATGPAPWTFLRLFALATVCLTTLCLPVTVLAAPTVTSVVLKSGSVAGGTFVTVNGTGFAAGATVTIGGTAAPGVKVVSATQITCQTPPHAFGIADVTVTNPDTTSGTAAGAFTYTSSGTPPPGTAPSLFASTDEHGSTSITAGPDSNLWYTHVASGIIGKMTTNGTVLNEFGTTGGPESIVTGPDRNLWFAKSSGNAVGMITTAGTVTDFTLPHANSQPRAITPGPDGNLWFTEESGDRIGRITTGGTITEYPTAAGSALNDIVAGPDGNLWFTAFTNTIGKINPFTATPTTPGIVTFAVPSAGAGTSEITLGPDGNLWFTEASSSPNGNRIGRITTAGVFTEFTLPNASSVPLGIASGPDGNVWFSEQSGNRIGTITPAGAITEYTVSTPGTNPRCITTGPGGNIWFGGNDAATHVIGRLPTPFPTITGITPTSGTAGGGTTITVTGRAFSSDATLDTDGFATILLTRTPTQITARTLPHAAGAVNLSVDNGDGFGAFTTYQYTAVTAAANPSVQEFSAGITSNSVPSGIVAGSDGNLWFTEDSGSRIGRITLAGAVTEFTLPTAGSRPITIAAGPDGNLWFTERNGGNVGRITPAGSITEFAVGDTLGIVAGPDGALWFTARSSPAIGRITPEGSVALFPIQNGAFAIAAGLDGNLWFTALGFNGIGRITRAGVVTMFSIATTGSQPIAIAAGPDGNLWFVENSGNKIGRITPSGTITEFTIPTASSSPSSIAAGPDGNLWFTETLRNKIGRITPSGTITEFALGAPNAVPQGIALGPDGNLWYTAANKIGLLFASPPTLGAISPAAGPANAQTNVTITGTGFAPGATVTFDGIPAPVVVTNPTSISAVAPTHAAGSIDVVVRNPDATTARGRFTYGAPSTLPNPEPPGATSGSPASLPNPRAASGSQPGGPPAPLPNPRP